MRRFVGRGFVAAGVLALLACALFAVALIPLYLERVRMDGPAADDLAGFSLGLTFLLYLLLPSAGALLLAGFVIDPRALPGSRSATLRRFFVAASLVAGALAGVALVRLVVHLFLESVFFGAGPPPALLLQNLPFGLPLLALTALLLAFGARLAGGPVGDC